MTAHDGKLTVGALSAIITAGLHLDKTVDFTCVTSMRQTLMMILADPDKTCALWRALRDLSSAALELRVTEVSLGGKVKK